jgi:hypothetical protein
MIGIAKPALVALTLLGMGAFLGGCANFDPETSLDFLNLSKKEKLPGERRPVFPEGVPGVTQGVPPDLIKGNQPQPAPETAAVAPAEPEARPEAKPKPKPRVARRPAVTVAPEREQAPQQQQPAQQQPAQQQPAQQQQTQTGANAPWPAPSAPQQPSPWPSAPPPGTFQR